MFDKTKKYSVKNRSASRTVYILPDFNNLRREFAPGEVKEISGEELVSLANVAGGQVTINDYLLITDVDAKKEVVTNQEPEYDLDEKGVVKLLTSGSNDQLIDCLNFGPEGVKELIKQIAIAMPLNDLNKCDTIKTMLGFDVVETVRRNAEIAAEEGVKPQTEKRRRVAANGEAKTESVSTRPARKASKPASN